MRTQHTHTGIFFFASRVLLDTSTRGRAPPSLVTALSLSYMTRMLFELVSSLSRSLCLLLLCYAFPIDVLAHPVVMPPFSCIYFRLCDATVHAHISEALPESRIQCCA